MKVQLIGATTHIDRHFTRFSKGALEDAANQVNGNRKPRFGVEHDSTVPPLGKVLEAWVEPREDGEYQLVEVAEIFEDYLQARLSNDVVFLKQECETDKNPFTITVHEVEEKFVVIYDRVNFGDEENRQAFLVEIKNAEIEFIEKEISRKSAIPDPEIIIQLTELVIEFLLQ